MQEVTLRKSGSAEKLGLTVCYSSGSGSEDVDTEVYISEIVPESLAARDGRLREGDQILRVKSGFSPYMPTLLLFSRSKAADSVIKVCVGCKSVASMIALVCSDSPSRNFSPYVKP